MHPEASSNDVVKSQLSNSLVVLFKEDHSNPVVAINVWYRIGSAYESRDESGLAHFQEHMVFKGTQKYGVGEIADVIKSAGGNLNAATSYSYTEYYVVLPSRSFGLGLEVQADAMMNSTFDADEFQKERLVVIEEARMYDDTPEAYTYYRTMELGFRKHNYRRPIAGYEKVVSKFTREQLFDFYRKYYNPENAILVVVGDIGPDEAMKEIERVYGAWRASPVDRPESPAEPTQRSFRFKSFPGKIDHAYLGLGFHVPNILDPDYPALEVLTTLLGSGKSSRLYRRVREEKRLVTTASASLLAEKWPGYLMVFASMFAPKWADARDAVFEEIVKFTDEPVSEEELLKARRQVEKDKWSELETAEGQASNFGYYEVMGDYRLAEKHRKAIQQVTAYDVMSAARKYVKPSNCSLAAYLPESTPGATRDEVETALRAIVEAGKKSRVRRRRARPSRAGSVPPPHRSTVPAAAGPPPAPSRSDLGNGVRVVCRRRSTVPLVAVLTVCEGGTRLEPKGKSGISVLSASALLKGSRAHTADEIARRIEGLGGRIESFSGFDLSGVYMNVLRDHLEEALDIYRDVIRHPAFAADSVEHEKKRLLEELARRHDHPLSYSLDHMFAMAFGDHPYGRPFIGDEAQLSALSENDCTAWHGGILVPGNTVVVFVGDIEKEAASGFADKLFGDMQPAPVAFAPIVPPPDAVHPGVHTLRKAKLNQAVGLVGFLGPRMLSPEAVSLSVLDGLMTGLAGRLFYELRDKRSLGYMAGSTFMSLKERSVFYGYSNPKPDRLDEAIDVILNELDRVCREPVLDREINRSKEWLVGSRTMKLQTNLAQAVEHGYYEAMGFGFETVERIPDLIYQVTKEDIRQAAASVFHREKAVCVKLVPESKS
jgi:zinc protease